jgi:hypothetical protein
MSARGHENVCRLDVAVHDSFGMRRIQRVRDFNSQLHHLFQRQRLARDALFQRLAFQKFHGNELLAVLLADVVNRADVRMI